MNSWIGLTIGQIFDLCGVVYADVQVVDEPPGKFRGVDFICREGGKARQVVLEVEYDSDLFSADRSWSPVLVQKQKVVKVHTSTDYLN